MTLLFQPIKGPRLLHIRKPLTVSPIEEVVFVRDVAANIAWGIEKIIEGFNGEPVNRYDLNIQEIQQKNQEVSHSPTQNGTMSEMSEGTHTQAPISYRLASDVPEYWIPFLPKQMRDK
jgi:hypothetical protein